MAGVDIKVPSLGESVTEATVAKWFKQAGEAVNADEPLVELETDKVTVEVNAPAAGTLSDIVVKPGDTVAVGAKLGTVTEGAGPAKAKPAAAPAKPAAPAAAPAAAPPAAAATAAVTGAAPTPGPAARKALAEANLAPAQVAGTGRDGRVTKSDVAAALTAKPATPAPAPALIHSVSFRRMARRMTKEISRSTTFNPAAISSSRDCRMKTGL